MSANAKSPVDLEVYWPSSHYSPDPPNGWTAWLEGFKIALFVKHSLDYDTPLADPTDAVPQPRFITAPTGETDEARETRMAANRTAQATYKQKCEDAWTANYNGTTRRLADQTARSMLFMSIGTEAKKKVVQQVNEFRLNDYTLATFHAELLTLFAQAKGVTVERIALFKRRHRPNEGLRTSTRHYPVALSSGTIQNGSKMRFRGPRRLRGPRPVPHLHERQRTTTQTLRTTIGTRGNSANNNRV